MKTFTSTNCVMFLGTASNVGKTSIALAFTRHLQSAGIAVFPFKSVSVGQHSHETASGGEIHVHQAQQAMAAKLEPIVEMNPVMFKTDSNGECTILINGKPAPPTDSPSNERTNHIRAVIASVYSGLLGAHEFIVVEGCGSPVELNIKTRDLANLWFAHTFGVPCVLIVNAENVGTFGSLIGTLDLMTPAERGLVIGFIVNKFHGDPTTFSDGVQIMEKQTGLPCLGVIPFMQGLHRLGVDQAHTDDPAAAAELDKEITRWTEHVTRHLDTKLLETLAFSPAPPNAAWFPHREPIWQGRLHLGDEPGVYGDAHYAGLCIELPFNIEDSGLPGSARFLVTVEAEHVNTFPPYPGHKLSVVRYRPQDPSNENLAWEPVVLTEAHLVGDTLEVMVDLTGIDEALLYMSLRLEIDTTVRAGLYDDFVLKRLGKRSMDFRYAASFGFIPPL